MYVIIFPIDKNYELYQELKEGVEMEVFKMKSPLQFCGGVPTF